MEWVIPQISIYLPTRLCRIEDIIGGEGDPMSTKIQGFEVVSNNIVDFSSVSFLGAVFVGS